MLDVVYTISFLIEVHRVVYRHFHHSVSGRGNVIKFKVQLKYEYVYMNMTEFYLILCGPLVNQVLTLISPKWRIFCQVKCTPKQRLLVPLKAVGALKMCNLMSQVCRLPTSGVWYNLGLILKHYVISLRPTPCKCNYKCNGFVPPKWIVGRVGCRNFDTG